MILPKNGRVIVIDDERDQAFPLISALSKFNISTTYFDGTSIEAMPEKKFDDARVVFLDINLNGASQPNWKNEKGLIINAITNILEPNIPYILFVWSMKSEDMAETDGDKTMFQEVISLFENELLDFHPIISPIEMEKNKIFDEEIIEKEGTEDELKYTLRNTPEETIELIKDKINSGISQVDSIEALLKWENIVDKSSAMVVNSILSLAKSNENIDQDLKQIYFNLALGYWGKTLKGKEASDIVIKSLVSLNSILNDKIEYEVQESLKIELLKDFPDKPNLNSSIKAELNRRLLFSEDLTSDAQPGNLYILENEEIKKDIVKNILDRSTFRKEYCEENEIEANDFYEGNQVKKEYKKPSDKFGFKKEAEAVKEAIYFEVELTPICDFSQNNRVFCRMVSGVIMDEKYRFKVKKTASYFYISPLFLFNGKHVNFYCDFRYIQSANISDIDKLEPELRVRHLFQSDIQSQLARQVSRPGIVSV